MKWTALGKNQMELWGEFSKRKAPIKTAVSLSPPAAICTCRRQQSPCQHVLALLLMHVDAPDSFIQTSPDPWIQRQLQQMRRLQPETARKGRSVQASPALRQGMIEFHRWLTDVARMGMATLPQQPPPFWQSMVHRLIDAQAPALAHQLRDLAKLPANNPHWPEKYLRQFSRLYLLAEAFQRFEIFSPAAQADMLTAVGQRPSPAADQPPITDKWLVLGRHEQKQNKQTILHIWLWAISRQRPACLRYLTSSVQDPTPLYATGSRLRGDLLFLPGTAPLFAEAVRLTPVAETAVTTDSTPIGHPTLDAAVAAYTQALTQNPWLSPFPLPLQAGFVRQQEANWLLLDTAQNVLPLPPATGPIPFRYGWHLCSLSGRRPINLFGLWDGITYRPLSIATDAGWQELHVWQGVA